MKKYLTLVCYILATAPALSQKTFNDFHQVYPIGESPSLRYMSSYRCEETILFEANPIARYSLYNNFIKGLLNEKLHTQAWYVSFRPQLRMYSDNSKPVRMPSYRIFLGTQHLFRLPVEKSKTAKFAGFSLESGHYSNGQDRSAFSEEYADDSAESNALYALITDDTDLSRMLNRKSGNFSTNMTELIFNYRTYLLDDDNLPRRMHSFNIGYVQYHNSFLGVADFGGYTTQDIKLYGRNRFQAEYEFMNAVGKKKNKRYTVKQHIEWIETPHASVNRLRVETMGTYYPFPKSKEFGFLASYIYGHDNYNFRFVDSGHQLTFGITWSIFPPISLSNKLETL